MTTATAARGAVVTLAFAAALTGCGGQETPGRDGAGVAATTASAAPAPGWREPARYSYTLESRCGEQQLIGRFRVTVVDGDVTEARGLDMQANAALRGTRPDFVPTLGELIAQADTARRAGAAVAEVESDPTDGHPVRVTIDHEKNTIDDESCFTISDYTPA